MQRTITKPGSNGYTIVESAHNARLQAAVLALHQHVSTRATWMGCTCMSFRQASPA